MAMHDGMAGQCGGVSSAHLSGMSHAIQGDTEQEQSAFN